MIKQHVHVHVTETFAHPLALSITLYVNVASKIFYSQVPPLLTNCTYIVTFDSVPLSSEDSSDSSNSILNTLLQVYDT